MLRVINTHYWLVALTIENIQGRSCTVLVPTTTRLTDKLKAVRNAVEQVCRTFDAEEIIASTAHEVSKEIYDQVQIAIEGENF